MGVIGPRYRTPWAAGRQDLTVQSEVAEVIIMSGKVQMTAKWTSTTENYEVY